MFVEQYCWMFKTSTDFFKHTVISIILFWSVNTVRYPLSEMLWNPKVFKCQDVMSGKHWDATAQQMFTIVRPLALVWHQTSVCFQQSLKIKLRYLLAFYKFVCISIGIPKFINIQNPKPFLTQGFWIRTPNCKESF
jgi:hypothetical protein